MQCPICNVDLEPLDLVSRTEHVDLCIENGPSVITIGDDGRATVKRNVPANKIRKVCPICDKTFQNLQMHYKTCSIKNDVPPSLMLEQWDKINADLTKPKKFPRELLNNFVRKCVREGRIGEQVEFARALSLSMSDSCDDDLLNIDESSSVSLDPTSEVGSSLAASTGLQRDKRAVSTTNEVLLQSRPKPGTSNSAATGIQKRTKQFRLETVDESTKRANVKLRIERELAATRARRYLDALQAQATSSASSADAPPTDDKGKSIDDSLFNRARLKSCDWSAGCREGRCQDHELRLLVDGFAIYSGRSIDSTPRKGQFGVECLPDSGGKEASDRVAPKADEDEAEAEAEAEAER